jgi:O-methyltransferase involved in polyketide biosynthesis
MYLTRDAVAATLDALASVCGAGSVLAMDFWQRVGGPAWRQVRMRAERGMDLIGEPINFTIPAAAVGGLFRAHGFSVLDLAEADEMTKRYATGGRVCDPGMYVAAAELT